MALILALQLLLAVATALTSQGLVPKQCLQGPEFWCQDAATAAQCQREQYCRNFWDDFTLWDQLEENEASVPKKCTVCTKIVNKIKSMIGDDPSEDDIDTVLNSVCKAMGRLLGRACKSLVKKYKDQITEALQNNQDAQEICTQIKMCKGSVPPPDGGSRRPEDKCGLCQIPAICLSLVYDASSAGYHEPNTKPGMA